jgi:hypothetical protein
MEEFNWYSLLNIIDFFLYGLLIIVVAYTLYTFFVDDIKFRSAHLKYRLRVKRNQLNIEKKEIPKGFWLRHLYRLFAVRTQNADMVTVYTFIAVEIFIGISIFILMTIQLQDAVVGILCAFFSMMIPYLFLYVSSRNIRNEISTELQDVVQTLLHSYSANRSDMYAALNMTHSQLKVKKSKLVLARLISSLQTAHDDKSTREIIDLFIFSTKSSWGLRLGNIIMKGYLLQENVTTALLTLQQQMVDHQKMMEEEKAGASVVTATGIITVIAFPVSLLAGKKLTEPQNWWHIQFGEPLALLSFVITFIFVAIAGIIAIIVRKPSNDL